jgi:hypothetical protein
VRPEIREFVLGRTVGEGCSVTREAEGDGTNFLAGDGRRHLDGFRKRWRRLFERFDWKGELCKCFCLLLWAIINHI